MNVYNLLSVCLAGILYVFLGKNLLKGTAVQNLATWILWGLLDAESAASLYAQDGNWQLPAFYVVGCLIMIFCMFKAKTVKWTMFETVIMGMVIGCLIMWWTFGAREASIVATIGVVMGGFPQLKDAYLDPATMPIKIYGGFVMVNILGTLAGNGWSVEERLYPATCVVLCAVTALLALARREFLIWKQIEEECDAGYLVK